jgi:hypothetical protein
MPVHFSTSFLLNLFSVAADLSLRLKEISGDSLFGAAAVGPGFDAGFEAAIAMARSKICL